MPLRLTPIPCSTELQPQMPCYLYLRMDFCIPNCNHLWYLMLTGAVPATWMLLWRCKTLTTHFSVAHFPTGLLFKVSGLCKIPQRPAFSLFSSINNLLLLCFSLQTKEKPILHIKIESSIAERAVMAQSILSSSGRGLTRCKQPLNPQPPPVLRPFAWRRWGQQPPFLPVSLPLPKAGARGLYCFSWWAS